MTTTEEYPVPEEALYTENAPRGQESNDVADQQEMMNQMMAQGVEGNQDGTPHAEAQNIEQAGEGEEGEEEDDEEEVQIVLNTDNPNASSTPGMPFRGRFGRMSIGQTSNQTQAQKMATFQFNKPQQIPNSTIAATSNALQMNPFLQGFQVNGGPIIGLAPGGKTILDIDIDTLEDKAWRKPGADITDYFNYGFNEDSWKAYCAKQVQLRLEQSMQGQIKVFTSSETTGKPDLPPELLAIAGPDMKTAPMQPRSFKKAQQPVPRKEAKNAPIPTALVQQDWGQTTRPTQGRRPRDLDESVIHVLASGEDDSAGSAPNATDSTGVDSMTGAIPFAGAGIPTDSPHETGMGTGAPNEMPMHPFPMGMPPMMRMPMPFPGMPMPRPGMPMPFDRGFPPRRDDRGPPRDYRERGYFSPPRESDERRESDRRRDEYARYDDRRRDDRERRSPRRSPRRDERPKEDRKLSTPADDSKKQSPSSSSSDTSKRKDKDIDRDRDHKREEEDRKRRRG